MKNNLFDNHVKQQLGNYKADVPPHIWENILAEKNRRKAPFLWGSLTGLRLAAAVLLALAAGGLTYYYVHNTAQKTGPAGFSENSSNNNNPAKMNTGVAKEQSATLPGTTDALHPDAIPQQNIPVNSISAGLSLTAAPALPTTATGKHNRFSSSGKINIGLTNGLAVEKNDPNTSTDFDYEKYLSAHFLTADLLRTNKQFVPHTAFPALPAAKAIPCPKAEREAAGNKNYVEVYAGPDYAFTSISDYNNAAYAQQRKQTAHTLMSYSAGIRYTKVFGSGMSVRAGLNYSQINEAFSQVKGHVTQNVYITNDVGDTTGTYSVSGTQYKKNTNKYRTLDIPVTAGYEFGNGKLHTNINAGAMINIASRQSGFVVDKNGNATDVSAKGSSVYRYKTNAGVSLTGGVSFYYKVTDRMHLLAEPYIRYSLSPVTQNDLELKQKYHTAGLRLGVRMDL